MSLQSSYVEVLTLSVAVFRHEASEEVKSNVASRWGSRRQGS